MSVVQVVGQAVRGCFQLNTNGKFAGDGNMYLHTVYTYPARSAWA